MNKIKHLSQLSKIFYAYKIKKTILPAPPIKLWIESTNICNLQCVMCPNKDTPANEKGVMSFDLFKKIIDEAKDFVYDIYLHHRGEPFIHPHLRDMAAYAKKNGLCVKFHTNGTVLSPQKAQEILTADLDLISFSFDGFSKPLYEKIRVNADFDKTINNILYFLQLKKQLKKTKPYTIVEEIAFPNEPEYTAASAIQSRTALVQKLKQQGLDELIVKKLYNWAGSYETPVESCASIQYTTCTFLWYAMVICWDGTVTPCPQDYFATLPMGSVKEQSIRTIWNNEQYQSLRKKMLASDISTISPCNKCDRLHRKKVMGVPFQYLFTFLNDNLVGYGKLRKLIGSYERNE